MTNYNERLDEILDNVLIGMYCTNPDGDFVPLDDSKNVLRAEAKQAITSLIKELVDEQVVQALKELKEEKKVVDVFASFGITKRIEAVPVKAIDNKIKALEEV